MNYFYYESMGANDPSGIADLDPRGMVGRIHVGNIMHCYILNIEAVGLNVFEKIIFLSFPHFKSMET